MPPGVDIEALERAALEAPATAIPDRRPRVVCVARHFPVKGVDVLVEAFPQVLEAVPGAGLVLVGGGPDSDELIARVAELGHRRCGALRGPSSTTRLPTSAAADLVVLPVATRRSARSSALEALALERAVVATAVGGTPDVVRPGETGWLVPPEQPGALADAIVEALLDPGECARRAAAAVSSSSAAIRPRS